MNDCVDNIMNALKKDQERRTKEESERVNRESFSLETSIKDEREIHTDVTSIVKQYLLDNKYDGLSCPSEQCACNIENLFFCSSKSDVPLLKCRPMR